MKNFLLRSMRNVGFYMIMLNNISVSTIHKCVLRYTAIHFIPSPKRKEFVIKLKGDLGSEMTFDI